MRGRTEGPAAHQAQGPVPQPLAMAGAQQSLPLTSQQNRQGRQLMWWTRSPGRAASVLIPAASESGQHCPRLQGKLFLCNVLKDETV